MVPAEVCPVSISESPVTRGTTTVWIVVPEESALPDDDRVWEAADKEDLEDQNNSVDHQT